MGTNFAVEGYFFDFIEGLYVPRGANLIDHMDPGIHIGKRSAAGYYCWDCNETLYRGGVTRIHSGKDEGFFASCPKCGKKTAWEGAIPRATSVELGFSKPNDDRPTGVRTCSSFSWAQPPGAFKAWAKEHLEEELVVNEYGDKMTVGAFLNMLRTNCPIESVRMVGEWFG